MRTFDAEKVATTRAKLALATGIVLGAFSWHGQSQAATITWDGNAPGGTGNDFWGTANNWNPNTAPPVSDNTTDIVMTGSLKQANRINNNYVINTITFQNGGFAVSPQNTETLTLSGTGSGISSTGSNQISAPIILGAANTWTSLSGTLTVSGGVTVGANNLLVNGAGDTQISGAIGGGAGNLTKQGNGTLTLSGVSNHAYAGTSTVNAGTLVLNNTHAGGGNYAVTALAASAPATFAGTGTASLAATRSLTVTGFDSTARAIVAPGATATPATLTVGNAANTGANANAVSFGNFSRLAIDVSGGAADRLTINGNLNLTSSTSDDLVITVGSTPTLGKYTILSYSGSKTDAGTTGFTTVSGVPTNYRVSYDNFNASNGTIDLVHKATIGTVTATPADTVVIKGASTAITLSVQNSAPTNSDSLNFTTTAGTNVTGSASGTVVANSTGGPFSGLVFDSTSAAYGPTTGNFTVNGPNATNTSAPGTVNVTVLSNANASFNDTADDHAEALDLGTFTEGTGVQSVDFANAIYNLLHVSGYTADLDLDQIDAVSGDTSTLTLPNSNQFTNLVAGQSENLLAQINTSVPGSFSAVYQLRFSDKDGLAGATTAGQGDVLTVTLTGNVSPVPEPTTLAVLGLGFLGIAGSRCRHRS